jgi:AraC family transcriptional regulator, positive regulator of tynA and feaB
MSQKLDAEFLGKPQMDHEVDHETWTALLSSLCGLYRPEGIQPATFRGSAHTEKFCGLDAIDISGNACRVERTYRDVRLDGIDFYFATLQFDGQSTLADNDQILNLAVGDVVLYDNTRPATWVSEGRRGRWFSFALPRQQLISHLGVEPEGGLYAHGTRLPARLLLHLVLDVMAKRESGLIPTSCSDALAVSSKMASPIQTSSPPTWLPSSEFRYAICTDSFRNAARPAVNSSTRRPRAAP